MSKVQIEILYTKQKHKDDDNKVQVITQIGNNNKKYSRFIQSISDALTILKNDEGIDIYDQDLYLQKSIKFSSKYKDAKLIKYNKNQYLVIQYIRNIECYKISSQNNTAKRQHISVGEIQESEVVGNSCIDYFYSAAMKYGIYSPYDEQNNKHIILSCGESHYECVQKYARQYRYIDSLIKIQQYSKENQNRQMQWTEFVFLVLTRATIHISSIENQKLIPLKNGLNNRITLQQKLKECQEDENEKQTIHEQLLETIMDQIQIGVYEQILQQQSFDKIKIISIMGRQSLGKSYLLNRLFGTRFNVDSKRCTDGIWLSMSAEKDHQDKNILYVLIDCEGLFNIRRQIEEELQLVLVCFAISDLMIFNLGNNFDRKLIDFFTKLEKLAENFQNNEFFQGQLLFLVRDIPRHEKKEVMLQLENDIEKKIIQNKNIKKKTFKNIMYDTISSFEDNQYFEEDLMDIKSDIVCKLPSNYDNPMHFLENMKLILARAYLGIDDDIGDSLTKIKVNKSSQRLLLDFIYGSIYINKSKLTFKSKYFQSTQFEISQQNIQFCKIKIQQEKLNTCIIEKKEYMINQDYHKVLLICFNKKLQYRYCTHEQWIQDYFQFCSQIIQQRIQLVLQQFEQQILGKAGYKKYAKINYQKLEEQLAKVKKLYSKCGYIKQKCSTCDRTCIKQNDHLGECNCMTDHICQNLCSFDRCKELNYRCQKIYGHKDKIHSCNKVQHNRCQQKCQISGCADNCKYLVLDEVNHQHKCFDHYNQQSQCFILGCNDECQIHVYGQKYHESIDNTSLDTEKNFHQETETLINNDQSFKTTKSTSADEDYNLCEYKCPRCKINCQKPQNHKNQHYNENHDNIVLSNLQGEQKTNQNIQNDQQLQESLHMIQCVMDCKIKGRAHTHRLKCIDQNQCKMKLYGNQVEHQQIQGSNGQTSLYDLLLCQQYFQHYNWLPPAQGPEQDIINQCNEICQHCEDIGNQREQIYCKKLANHQDAHEFEHEIDNKEQSLLQRFLSSFRIFKN